MDWLLTYINAIRDYAKDYVLENTELKVLALLITAVIWLSVAARPVSQLTLHNVPIQFANVPDSPPMTVSKFDTLTARVYLRGPREVLDGLRSSDITAFADLAGVEPGVRVVQLRVDRHLLPSSVEEIGVEPQRMTVTVERLVEKEVPVVPRFEGMPGPEYQFIGHQIAPSTICVVGAESFVRDIEQVSTETINLAQKKGTFSEIVKIDVGSENISPCDQQRSEVLLTVNIIEVREERAFDRLPITVSGGDERTRTVPRVFRVVLEGPVSLLGTLAAESIILSVEQPQDRSRWTELPVNLSLPPELAGKVNVISIEPRVVRVR